MRHQHIKLDIDSDSVAWITLDRPEKHNALSLEMMHALIKTFQRVDNDEAIRAVVLSGAGGSFCAGADLKWMRSNLDKARAQRIDESKVLANMLRQIDQCPKLVIGRINGQAFGGGIGLISVCDVAIGVDSVDFALSEVRLGLVPANIAPYLVRRVGIARARRLALTACHFDARQAVGFGLLDAAVPGDQLDQAILAEIKLALAASPQAIASTKSLLSQLERGDLDDPASYLAEVLADTWEQAETRAGIRAFFNKTAPPWTQ